MHTEIMGRLNETYLSEVKFDLDFIDCRLLWGSHRERSRDSSTSSVFRAITDHDWKMIYFALWSPAGKGLTSWLSFVVSSVSLSLSHWYPGSGVVLDCIDS